MPISDLERIAEQATQPRAIELWRILRSLTSCASFMNTGAHPDDETSAMLAAIAFRDGLSISYACANRGEGGQNNIGSQSTLDLGVIRTAEMERAADVLGLRLYWLSESVDDSIFDFGFSKSGVETLERWGHERALQRFVKIIRTERPDIICTTFLDIPGQHGHHRAMTQLAQEVFDAAADENFNGVDLPVWQIKKLYLPAWSGAGDAYDDDLPPPPATLTLKGKGEEAISGWSYEQIGQHSRRFHLTQGMGRWVSPSVERDWPLHLSRTTLATEDDNLSAGLPTTLASLARFADVDSIASLLTDADNNIQSAIDAFPDLPEVRRAASKALNLVRRAKEQCPPDAADEVLHRLQRKELQLASVIRLSAGVKIRAWFGADVLRKGDSVPLHVEEETGTADVVEWTLKTPDGWLQKKGLVEISEQASQQLGFANKYLPGNPLLPALEVSTSVDGETSKTWVALETPPLLYPDHTARLSPSSVILNTASSIRKFQVDVADLFPAGASAELDLPAGWSAESMGAGFHVSVPKDATAGHYDIKCLVDGNHACTVNRFEFPHTRQCMRVHPATLHVCVLNVEIPDIKVGYVGGGNDRVAERLAELGFNVVSLSDEQLSNADALANLDTLVVGLFAVRMRPQLQQLMPEVHQWVNQGGNLLTLYHRPWDDWNENTIPLRRLLIGKPSLRWRVTDENATVNYLQPDHPLLNTPNIIGDTDWLNWHKERGLYFAAEWDSAYEALLSMSDPDEKPLSGALLSANIGKGRHTHTSLILHHQMEKLVPGAYRLMANLVVGAR